MDGKVDGAVGVLSSRKMMCTTLRILDYCYLGEHAFIMKK